MHFLVQAKSQLFPSLPSSESTLPFNVKIKMNLSLATFELTLHISQKFQGLSISLSYSLSEHPRFNYRASGFSPLVSPVFLLSVSNQMWKHNSLQWFFQVMHGIFSSFT